MLSHFFIRRPIFSGVMAIIIVIAGLMASQVLPVAQYPEIAPPTVAITAAYPGASAETLAKTVAAPIEEQLSGVENMIYFDSTASSTGTLNITATFEVGTDINNAVIQVNNRVQIALPRLPEDLRYSARMIANAMAIAAREHAAGDITAMAELARLQKLYREPQHVPAASALRAALSNYNRRLAADIRAGRCDDWDRLREHLDQTTADQLAFTKDLIRTPSPNPPGDERAVASLVRVKLAELGITQSMNRPGKVTDNAFIESFFHSMKSEIYHGHRYQSDDEIRAALKSYLPFYNSDRLHSSLDYVSPATFERQAR